MAAYGGLNHVQFLPSGEISVRPIIMPPERLAQFNDHLMLFYTGIKRTASEVADTYVNDIEDRRRQLRIINDLVKEGLAILSSNHDLAAFGELLHEAWLVKREPEQTRCPTPQVDEIYDEARAAGAVGGKLLGAGGGGFLMLFVPPERRQDVKQKLRRPDPRAVQHSSFPAARSSSSIRETDYSQRRAGPRRRCGRIRLASSPTS